jgi:tetratricopeptide (TPR) repeat protein
VKDKVITDYLLFLLLAIALAACGGAEDRKHKYFSRGKSFYEQGDYVNAHQEIKKVLHIDPHDVEAHYMYGLIEVKEEHWQSAYTQFLKVIELDPLHADAHVHLGMLYIYYDEAEQALKAADAALQINPKDVAAMVLKGRAYLLLNQGSSAFKLAKKALEVDANNSEATSLIAELYADQGEVGRAIRLVKAAIDKHPQQTALHLLLARLYDKAGESDRAMELLKKLIKLQPDELHYRLQLTSYYLQKNRQRDAEQVLQNAVVDLPEKSDAKLALVQLLTEQGEKARAQELLKQFIEQSPLHYDLQLELADQYLRSNRVDDAKEILLSVIDDAGESAEGLSARAKMAALLLIDKEMNQALTLANEVLAIDPKNTEALMIRATIALESNAPDASITDLRVLLKEDPNYVAAYRLKAKVHIMKNEIGLARQTLEDAIQLQTREVAENIELAQLLVKSGNLDDAVILLEKIRGLAPDNVNVLERLGEVYSTQERWEQVGQTANALIKKYPSRGLGYYYSGLALQGRGLHTEAIKKFKQSLSHESDAIEPVIGIAGSQLALGRSEEAISMLRPAYDSSKNILLGMELAILLDQSGESEEAIRVYQDLLVQRPDFSLAANNLAMMLLRGNPDKAALDKALELVKDFETSENPVFLDTLGWAWVKQQDLEKAVSVLERAVKMQPGLPDAEYHLGVAYYGLGRMEDAKKYLEKSVASDDKFPGMEQAKILLDELK